MKKNIRKIFAVVLVICMMSGILPSAMVSASAESTAESSAQSVDTESILSEENSTTRSTAESEKSVSEEEDRTESLTGYLENRDDTGILAENHNISVRIEAKDKSKAFPDNDKVRLQEIDPNVLKAAEEKLASHFPDGLTTLAGYDISLLDENNKETEPDKKVAVRLYMPKETVSALDGAKLYHIKNDGTVEKLDFTIKEEPNLSLEATSQSISDKAENTKKDKIAYVAFETDSFSPFLFVKDNKKEETKADTVSPSSEQTGNEYASDTEEMKPVTVVSKKNGLRSSYAMRRVIRKAPTAPVSIQSLKTTLFAGAAKQDDGTYQWTPTKPDAGHAFAYRISFSTSGEGTLPKEAIKITVPADIFNDRNNNDGDSTEWSIPSREEVQAATNADGTLNPDLMDTDQYYAYYKDGDNFVIYNFREVSAAQNNYIELSYTLTKPTFDYKDMENHVFTCSMSLNDSAIEKASPINTAINTSAELTYTRVQYPGSRIKTWNDSWGDAVKPANSGNYYYLVFRVESGIKATQPYTFTLSDSELKSNLGNQMTILGYQMSGESTFSAQPHEQSNQRLNERRYDYVLVGIPLANYRDGNRWEATYKVSGNVTPSDGIDSSTMQNGQNTWSWTQPVFHEQGSTFNGAKRGDGAYRTYNGYVYRDTSHLASDRDVRYGNWSRYDLETFNGFSEDGQDTTPEVTSYGGFDFGSWLFGYPGSLTADGDKKSAANYWHKNVRYELTDEGVYLLNTDKALKSGNGSSERTIENKAILDKVDGKTSAIKLTHDDFRIDKLEYSWAMQDAVLDDETMTFKANAPTYKDTDIITFEGKFNGSDDWIPFATYNIKTGAAEPNTNYVSSMDKGTITFKDGQDLTAYRVSTSNAHYYTELFTVPFYSLKNSTAVMDLLKGSRTMILLDNNVASLYQNAQGQEAAEPLMSVHHSDTDYATASVKDSSLKKRVVSYSNNTRTRRYTITWRIDESETVQGGEEGKTEYIPQRSGIFYDLLPGGAVFTPSSVDANAPYTVQTIKNYQGSGRTMLIIKMTGEADRYYVTFDTVHSWNSINDYGRTVHNPVAYETGNDSITKGDSDNGGPNTVDKVMMADLAKNTGQSDTSLKVDNSTIKDWNQQIRKFLFASYDWDITSLLSASSGLSKKVKTDKDRQYSRETKTTINDEYSYELRYMTSPGTDNKAKNVILYDSLENFGLESKKDDGSSSDWHGTLSGIDVSQLKSKHHIAPVVYISTKEKLDPEKDNNLSDSSVWTRVSESDLSDPAALSNAKAVAIDATKKDDGSDFILEPGDSLVAYLSMKTPATAPDAKKGEAYPYTYNNVYVSNELFGRDDQSDAPPYMIHYDYTRASLTVSGNLFVRKLNAKTQKPASGITFRLFGTSDYGTAVDTKLISGTDGMISAYSLEKGSYTLQEYDPTDDYLLDPTVHTVTIGDTGQCKVDDHDATYESPFEITNQVRVHTDVFFKKVNSLFTGTTVEGAEYRLSGRSDYGTDVLMTGKTNREGRVTFENVEKGTYELKEVSSPEDYILDRAYYEVVIDEDGNFTISKEKATQETAAASDQSDATQAEGEPEKVEGIYILKDEPLHYFTFTKKSSYDKSVIGGAEFYLTGTSDNGTKVDMTATSEDKTGTVRFSRLEPGNYILKETKAPEGYYADGASRADPDRRNTHVVEIKNDGTYSISGLNDESKGNELGHDYVLYDTRKADKSVTVTKVWDDGITEHDPNSLGMTVTTKVPEASDRTYTIIYDANGGHF